MQSFVHFLLEATHGGSQAVRVAIQGEPGSNSHLAVLQLLGEQDLVPCSLSAEVFEQMDEGRADVAVLPIENSLHGAVADHYDLLLQHPVTIHAELSLRIHHALIGVPGATAEGVRRVLSHPVALSQCRRFFLSRTGCQAVPAYDTAGSVKLVVAAGDATQAAIAAPYAAVVHGGKVLATDLEDDPQNFTRFLLLYPAGSAPADTLEASTPVKVSLAFAIPHRPGSLVAILSLLGQHGADLTRIESRPVPGRPWEYVFFVDLRLQGSATMEPMMAALKPECSMVKLLGRYAAAAEAPVSG